MTIEWENPYEHQRLRARFDADDAQAAELAALMRALAQVSTAAQWKVTGMRTAGHPPDQPPSSRVFDSA